MPPNLDKIIQEAEQGETIQITQQGKQTAVILSHAEYEKLLKKTPNFWESVERFRQEYDIEAADINPDEIFASGRDKSSERKVIF
ncbi:type II toxin-antitoxin system Phd/YefM family antitoxin [Dulcicalothrix desertica]|uniref:type II toxin-antitoxin system Phd/YefM family antitoxin n=1 Tax=Dulcicalothrix desertica TaxID=32056 RepID=UPI00398916D5